MITGKNMELFKDFMQQIANVQTSHQEIERKMRNQTDFFNENKQRYQDVLDKMEEMQTYYKTSEQIHEEKFRSQRDEIDRIELRINEKDKQNNDMLNQVIDQEFKVQEIVREVKEFNKKQNEMRKQVWLYQPLATANLVFDTLFAINAGTAFNKVRDHFLEQREKFVNTFENVEARLNQEIEEESYFLADIVPLREVPEKQAEDPPRYQFAPKTEGHLALPRHSAAPDFRRQNLHYNKRASEESESHKHLSSRKFPQQAHKANKVQDSHPSQ